MLITWPCFFNKLSLTLYELIVTIHIHDTISCQKLAAERKYCRLFWLEILEQVEIIFRGDIAMRISGNLAVESILKFTVFSKLKTEKKVIGECKMWLDLKVSMFNSQTSDRRSLYATNLDANWNTSTGLCLAFYRRQPYKSFTVNLQICLL